VARQIEINFVYEDKKKKKSSLRRDVKIERRFDDLFADNSNMPRVVPTKTWSDKSRVSISET